MGWQIDSNGNIVGSGGKDCASDAMKIWLLPSICQQKWGSGRYNYGQEATNLINNLYNYCVEQGTYVLKPGDTWGGSQVTNHLICTCMVQSICTVYRRQQME